MEKSAILLLIIFGTLTGYAQDTTFLNKKNKRNVIKVDVLLPIIYELGNIQPSSNEQINHNFMISYERFIKKSFSIQINTVYSSDSYESKYKEGTRVLTSGNDFISLNSGSTKEDRQTVYLAPNLRWFFKANSKGIRGFYANVGINFGYNKFEQTFEGQMTDGENFIQSYQVENLFLGPSVGAGWEFF